MRIGELSKRTGVSSRSLRYYEEQGLLTSSRSDAGQRHYSDAPADLATVENGHTSGKVVIKVA